MKGTALHRCGLVLALGALLLACSKPKKSSAESETSGKPREGQSTGSGEKATSAARAPETPSAAPSATPSRTSEIAYWYGANYASAHEFMLSGAKDKYDKYFGRAQKDAKDLGLSAPAPPSKEGFATDVATIVKEVLGKHGVTGRALFVCGLQVRKGLGRAADNEEITKKNLKEPLFDLRSQVEDLETSLPRTGLPPSVWREALTKLKASPSREAFEAMLRVLGDALAPK